MLTARPDTTDPAPEPAPVSPDEFAGAMAALGPWEQAPRLAVAVSGGPDSLALALLADSWARDRGGDILALTVDHRLRPESGDEARRVAGWLDARGIAQRTLVWSGCRGTSAIQAEARAARHRLLAAACREAGILHLLLGHHRQDQAETAALRRAGGSGPDGLAAMPSVRETAGPRLLRPLLNIDPGRLRAVLRARRQPWIDDPSNRDRRYARARLRLDGVPPLPDDAAAARRADGERATAALAALAVEVAPDGYALIDPAPFRAAPPGDRRRLLTGILRMVGGGAYPPRSARLDALVGALAEGLPRARTLAGCRVLCWRGRVLVCREPGAIGAEAAFDADGIARWDGRFDLYLAPPVPPGWRIGALGRDGCRAVGRTAAGLPPPVVPSLAAVRCDGALLAVPALGWQDGRHLPQIVIAFAPSEPLVGGPFGVV